MIYFLQIKKSEIWKSRAGLEFQSVFRKSKSFLCVAIYHHMVSTLKVRMAARPLLSNCISSSRKYQRQPPRSQLSLISLPESSKQQLCFPFSPGAKNKVSILDSHIHSCKQISTKGRGVECQLLFPNLGYLI